MYQSTNIYGNPISEKETKTVCRLRQKLLQDGHCPRCGGQLAEVRHACEWFPEKIGELITKGIGVTEDGECPKCEINLIEFCFEDLLNKAKDKAKKTVDKARETAKVIKKHGKPDVEMRQSNGDVLLCYRIEKEEGCLF